MVKHPPLSPSGCCGFNSVCGLLYLSLLRGCLGHKHLVPHKRGQLDRMSVLVCMVFSEGELGEWFCGVAREDVVGPCCELANNRCFGG